MGPSLRFHWGNSRDCNPTCIYFFSIHSTSWIKICKIFMYFAKFGDFPAFKFFNWNFPQLFQGMDSQRNLLYSFFQSFLFWSDWMLSIGLVYCCNLKPTVESKTVKEFCFFVFIIFDYKISISLINNFSIFISYVTLLRMSFFPFSLRVFVHICWNIYTELPSVFLK